MATWDRNASPAGNNASITETNTSTQNSQSTTNSSGSKSGSTSTQNMDPTSMAALQALIAQLLGGGTQQMAQDEATRRQEIGANQAFRNQYSKEAAFADSQGAMAQLLQQAMESAMPSLVRSAEGAGTSANSMRALMTQDALNRASQSSAALGLNAAQGYGQIAANFSSILENLTKPNTTVVDALLNALNVAKGAITNTQYSETSSGTQNTSGTATTTSSGTKNATSGGTSSGSSTSGGLSGFSGSSALSNLTNAQWNALAKEAGGNVGWANSERTSGLIF